MFHLLYIDDDLIDRMSLERLVKKIPYIDCTSVSTLAEIQTHMEQAYFDCVIADFHVPGVSLEDIESLTQGLPILIVSGVEVADRVSYPSFVKPLEIEPLQQAFLQIRNEQGPDATLDLAYLSDLADGDTDFIEQIIHVFKEEVPEELLALEESYVGNDWEKMAFHVHKLRSKVRVLGLHELKKCSDELEPLCKSQSDLVTAKSLARQFIYGIKNALIQIYQHDTSPFLASKSE